MTRNLWGGRFADGPSRLLRDFNDSFSFDRELLAVDVQGSIAWARALGGAAPASGAVLTPAEVTTIIDALAKIPPPSPEDDYEDVHSYVEAKLRETVGPLAGKLHTGRSRNDQVATDLRLWLRGALDDASALVTALARELARIALAEAATPMPGYTHSKRAEPITFGHWCMAYVAMLQRDLSRVADAKSRGDECPLGSAALAGTPLDIDRHALARDLGFARPSANSIDAVADRDLAAEYLFAASLLLSHLSRLAEDLIVFTSDEARFAELPDALSTGSSRMPQKKNPDVLELVRGHAARSIGELTGLLTLLKGLPLAYDKDLQLDKEPLFRTRLVLDLALPALQALLAGLKLDRARMAAAASSDLLMATHVADALAGKGMPFREAHEKVGAAMLAGTPLHDLGVELDVADVLARKKAFGGTAPERVREAAEAALHELSGEAPASGAWRTRASASPKAGDTR